MDGVVVRKNMVAIFNGFLDAEECALIDYKRDFIIFVKSVDVIIYISVAYQLWLK